MTRPPGDSYWVIGGRLLAGPYPGAKTPSEAERKLERLLDAGVTSFLDLTEEDEGLEPYEGLLREIAARRSRRVTHRRFPVQDLGVPSEPQMREILSTVRRALDADEVVYVHCWGGVGRTGTLVGCLLMDDGCRADDVLARIAVLREGTERRHRASPETPEQRRFVVGWK